jgi:Zn-finger protein
MTIALRPEKPSPMMSQTICKKVFFPVIAVKDKRNNRAQKPKVGRESRGLAWSCIDCWIVERLRAIAEKKMSRPMRISDSGLLGLLIRGM